MKIEDIMTKKVTIASMDDTLGDLKKIFESNDFHHMPIVDANRLIGIVSDRDVLRFLSPYVNTMGEDNRALNTLKKRAHQIMTRDVFTVRGNDSVEGAAAIMLENRFSCLPVLSDSGAIIGIVTKTNILDCLVRQGSHFS
ncbi:MAG: CBS domain-containing protein [Planctomycetes bacterium]|nr:CBS domain-containing protein [Planctomycetota bacterium]